MMYQRFPHSDKELYFSQKEALHIDSIVDVNTIATIAPSASVSIEMLLNHPIYTISEGFGKQTLYYAASGHPVQGISDAQADAWVQQIFNTAITKVDTIHTFDTWTPTRFHQKFLPYYRYHINDGKGTQLYVSPSQVAINQQTNTRTRLLSYFGAIPHWAYFKKLRLNATLWKNLIVWISAIASFYALTGMVIGVVRMRRKSKRKHRLNITPYKHKWFKWHHITGFIFGISIFTFAFSGMMSLVNIPTSWIAPSTPVKYASQWNKLSSDTAQYHFQELYQQLNDHHKTNDIRKITAQTMMGRMVYTVCRQSLQSNEHYLYQNNNFVQAGQLSKQDIKQHLQDRLPNEKYHISKVQDNDYYLRAQNKQGYYRIAIENDHSSYLYINDTTGLLYQQVDKAARIRRWLYSALHNFKFGIFTQYEWLRQLLLWVLMLGGTAVSITGVYLSVRFIRRKVKS